MEIHQPSSPVDFDFNHGRASPCSGSSPLTPKGFKNFSFFSVPSSPARASEFYNEVDGFKFATIPELEILRQSETIKSPLLSPISSPVSGKSRVKRSFWTPFSPNRRKESKLVAKSGTTTEVKTERGRGRERVLTASSSRSGRRESRSLSPLRVSKYPWEEQQQQKQQQHQLPSSSSSSSSSTSTSSTAIVPVKGSRKWRLKDLLLFRSASEGRASDKDPLKKYADLYKRYESGKGHVSPHELHYTVNKKISEDMKKKSFLPYKQVILGRLAFNPLRS